MVWIWIAIGLLALLSAAVVWAYMAAFYSNPRGRAEDMYDIPKAEQYRAEKQRMRALIAESCAVKYQEWRIVSRDGLGLAARYYPADDPAAPVEIMMHGYRGSAIRDFCGGAKLARELGHGVLLIDERAHGRSAGSTICFGVKERWDCLSWTEEVRRRLGDVKVILSGVSMGAATVLMASELPLPETVVGIVADCPFSSPEEIIAVVAGKMGLPAKIAMPVIRLSARLLGGFNLREADAVRAVRSLKVPVLLIHGEDDRFVPCDMSRAIHAANPELVQLHTFPGAGHGLSYIVDTERYLRLVTEFGKSILSEKARGAENEEIP